MWGIIECALRAQKRSTLTGAPFLFNSDRFRKIARLINITPALERDIIRQQLQRHNAERRQQH
ncbi:MAG TPA: hypothetical protein DIV60_06445, partial [Oscillibacter sp.]|nr:hypothetical protein [Oscillibacter sp.]